LNSQRIGQWFWNKLEDKDQDFMGIPDQHVARRLWNMSNKEFIELLLEYYND
jgi:hypothetical protein